MQPRGPLHRVSTLPKTFLGSRPMHGTMLRKIPLRRVFVHWIVYRTFLSEHMSGPEIVSEFPQVATRLSFLSVVHLPHSGRSGGASCILLPSVEVIPMECTMRLIRYHLDDCMIENHLSLLRIPDIPISKGMAGICIYNAVYSAGPMN